MKTIFPGMEFLVVKLIYLYNGDSDPDEVASLYWHGSKVFFYIVIIPNNPQVTRIRFVDQIQSFILKPWTWS